MGEASPSSKWVIAPAATPPSRRRRRSGQHRRGVCALRRAIKVSPGAPASIIVAEASGVPGGARRVAAVGKTLMEGGELYETGASRHLAYGRACDDRCGSRAAVRVARPARPQYLQIADDFAHCASRQRRADIVAKGFWVSDEATLIQDQPAIRKVDSKICFSRFDCCAHAAPRRLLQQNRPQAVFTHRNKGTMRGRSP